MYKPEAEGRVAQVTWMTGENKTTASQQDLPASKMAIMMLDLLWGGHKALQRQGWPGQPMLKKSRHKDLQAIDIQSSTVPWEEGRTEMGWSTMPNSALSVFWPNCYYLISLSFKILVWPRLLWVWVTRASGWLHQLALFLSILVTLAVVRKNAIHVSIFHSCGMTVERGRRRAMFLQLPSAQYLSSIFSGHFNPHKYTILL